MYVLMMVIFITLSLSLEACAQERSAVPSSNEAISRTLDTETGVLTLS